MEEEKTEEKEIFQKEIKEPAKEPDLQLGQIHKIGDEKKEKPKSSFNSEREEQEYDDFDDFEQDDELDNWMNEEHLDKDFGKDPMLRNMWQSQQRDNGLNHGFDGRDDDGFRGLDSKDSFGRPQASGFDFDEFGMESDKDFMLDTDFDVDMEMEI